MQPLFVCDRNSDFKQNFDKQIKQLIDKLPRWNAHPIIQTGSKTFDKN